MTVTLVLLTLLLVGIIGWLVRQSINVEPWEATSGRGGVVALPPRAVNARRLALGALLATITSLFALFLSAYLMRMHYPDWVSLPKPGLLWINTGMLMLGSAALQFASGAAVRGDANRTRIGLAVGGALTLAFIAGQWSVWRTLQAEGHYVATNPANGFFYLITALHVLHLVGGLIAWARPTIRLFRGAKVSAVRTSVELCTWYWHLLLVIWLILFTVLLAT